MCAAAVAFPATLATGPGAGSRMNNVDLPLATEIAARTGDGVFSHYAITATSAMPFAVGHLDPTSVGETHYDLFAKGQYHMTHDSCSLDGSAINSACVLVPIGAPQVGRAFSLQVQGQLAQAATYKLVVAHVPFQPTTPLLERTWNDHRRPRRIHRRRGFGRTHVGHAREQLSRGGVVDLHRRARSRAAPPARDVAFEPCQ